MAKTAPRRAGQSRVKYRNRDGAAGPLTRMAHDQIAPGGGRRTADDGQWELPAFDRYDDEVDPAALAYAVVLADHPEKPALVLAGRLG